MNLGPCEITSWWKVVFFYVSITWTLSQTKNEILRKVNRILISVMLMLHIYIHTVHTYMHAYNWNNVKNKQSEIKPCPSYPPPSHCLGLMPLQQAFYHLHCTALSLHEKEERSLLTVLPTNFQCWEKLLLNLMHYNIALLHKK